MELIRRGDWYDLISGLRFGECMEKLKPRRIGFQFSRLYTPWFTFGEVLAEDLRTRNDVAARMNFVNSWMAEPWIEQAEQQTEHVLYDRCVPDLPAQVCPVNTIALTCGIDPSKGGYWFVVLAWHGPGREHRSPHLIDYGFIYGKPDLQEFIREKRYGIVGDANPLFPLWRSGMDTGGGITRDSDETMTETAYAICRENKSYRLFGTKGESVRGVAKMRETIIDRMPGKKGKVIPGGLIVWLLNTNLLKQSCFDFLGFDKSEPGALTFHAGIGKDLVDHLTAEEKRRDTKSKKWFWFNPPGRDNHLFDALVIALAMGDPECLGGVNVLRNPQQLQRRIGAKASETIPLPRQQNNKRRVYSQGVQL